MEGQPGSPAIMFERAKQVADAGLVEKVLVRCSEPDDTNFAHLKEVCDGLTHPRVIAKPTQETFEDVAQRFITYAKTQSPPPPTFVMIDPYGVKGVRLDTLRQLLNFDRLEILLTFMVRDPARFLEANYDEALTALFGGDVTFAELLTHRVAPAKHRCRSSPSLPVRPIGERDCVAT